MATAFLTYEGDVLMMKKTKSRLFAFPFWAAPGGHLEPSEMNDPRTACLRELEEETGLRESDIDDLKLRYILLRRKEDEIWQLAVVIADRSSDFLTQPFLACSPQYY